MLKGIIHDWDDEAALKILKNCRRAIHPDGRLLVVEAVLTRSTDPTTALMDMLMMVLTSGRERTESEFLSLFGLSIVIHPLRKTGKTRLGILYITFSAHVLVTFP